MARSLIALLLLAPLSTCWTLSGGIPCNVGPPPLTAEDQLSDPMARWTVTVAETGEDLCHWVPPKGRS